MSKPEPAMYRQISETSLEAPVRGMSSARPGARRRRGPMSGGALALQTFQADIDTYSRNVKSKGPVLAFGDVTNQIGQISVGENGAQGRRGADDTRTLEDRIAHATADDVTSLGALMSQQLDRARGDIIIALDSHNLREKSLHALFELPSAADRGESISPSRADALLATVRAAATEIKAQATCLWPDEATRQESDFGLDAAKNDDAVTQRWTAHGLRVVVRRIPDTAEDLTELRCAVVGNVDAGKSTLLGVLTKGRLDDGRGRARVALFRHKHEIESGRTSSVGLEILGFDIHGKEVVDSAPHASGASGIRRQQMSWDEICKSAAKVISFIDLAGHERYLKTTIFGLTGNNPDCVCLVIGANAGLIGMSKEHLSVALALSVPVFCVVTKVDMTPANVLEQTLKQLTKILRSPGCRKQPVFVKNTGMAIELAASYVKDRACPIFLCSNVNGDGLTPLRAFLNAAPTGLDGRYAVDEPLEVSISETFAVPFVGCVVSGVVLSGQAKVGDNILIGPDSVGQWMPSAIKSIQRKRVNVNACEAGQSVTFALKRIRRNQVRKGMAVIAKTDLPPPRAVRKFEAQILVLYHNTTISPKYQAMCHTGSVRQTVRIVDIHDHTVLRTGDRARVTFEFVSGIGEYIRPGQKLLFREGRCKGLGVVTRTVEEHKDGTAMTAR